MTFSENLYGSRKKQYPVTYNALTCEYFWVIWRNGYDQKWQKSLILHDIEVENSLHVYYSMNWINIFLLIASIYLNVIPYLNLISEDQWVFNFIICL